MSANEKTALISCKSAPAGTGLVIGNLRLQGRVLLAPMSGVSDRPFRGLVKRYGVALAASEMIAGQAMIRQNRQTLKLAGTDADEHPLALQLAGCDPAVLAEAARLNVDRGAAVIDLNFGCPVKKVVSGMAGSALMRDEALAGRILEAVVRAAEPLPTTLKMRLGWDDDSRNAPVLARIAEAAGIKLITVHGRTRMQFYEGRADWAAVRATREATRLPLVVNGDIKTVDDAAEALAQSGADGVMIGRGACGRPWFPAQVEAFLATGERVPDPSAEEQAALLLEHLDLMIDYYGGLPGLRTARKHIGWAVAGLPGAAAFREAVNRIDDAGEVRDRIRALYSSHIERIAA
jgi:tRNA-dihydrouridine synthase B